MRRLIVILGLLFLTGGALAQPADPLLTFGRGEIVSAAWAPDGNSVWISTTAGTWQLDANLQEIAAYPHITYAALSPDGTKLAGAALGGYTGVWDAASGEEIQQWRPTIFSWEAPDLPVWSPDSQRFILNTLGDHSAASPLLSGGLFVLGDNHGPQPLSYGRVRHAAWSRTGAYFALYDPYFSRVFVFTREGDNVSLQSPDSLSDLSPSGESTFLDWRGDTELAYSSYGDGSSMRRWSIPDGAVLDNAMYSHCFGYGGCSYSADDHYAALGDGAPRQDALIVFDLETQSIVFEYAIERGFLTDPVWRPDGERIASYIFVWPNYKSKGIVVLDRRTSNVVWKRNDTKILPVELLWSPDGTRLLTYDTGGQMAIFDGNSGAVIAESDLLYNAVQMSFRPDDTLIAAATAGGSVRLIDMATDETIRVLKRSGQVIAQMLWQPGGGRLAIRDRLRFTDGGVVHIWDTMEEGAPISLPETESTGNRISGALSIAWSSDGMALAAGGYSGIWIHRGDETIALPLPDRLRQDMGTKPVVELAWRRDSDLPIAAYLQPCSHCLGYSYYPEILYDYDTDSTYIIAPDGWQITRDGFLVVLDTVNLFNAKAAALILQSVDGSEVIMEGSSIFAIERTWLSPNGAAVAVTDTDGNGMVWDGDGNPIIFVSDVESLQWSPDETTLAILRRDGSLWLQDVDGLRMLWSSVVPVRSPGTVVWSGDGSTVALVQDGVARIWRP